MHHQDDCPALVFDELLNSGLDAVCVVEEGFGRKVWGGGVAAAGVDGHEGGVVACAEAVDEALVDGGELEGAVDEEDGYVF